MQGRAETFGLFLWEDAVFIRILHASAGKVGKVRKVDDPSGRVLILLKKAEIADRPNPQPIPVEPKSRAYKRRDVLTAAPLAVEAPTASFVKPVKHEPAETEE